ncbi:MAG: GNAT family N-acetyltransferase [Jatrophihabitantaceae bacterium]
MILTLRSMADADLPLVAHWLTLPHVSRWWTEPVADEVAGYWRAVRGEEPTCALVAVVDGAPVGWCQWYRWADYPEASGYGARPGDVGIDYAIGKATMVGRGVGTAMIAQLLEHVRAALPAASLLVAVDLENLASRRVLAKNGFVLTELRRIASEPEELTALYRSVGESVGESVGDLGGA